MCVGGREITTKLPDEPLSQAIISCEQTEACVCYLLTKRGDVYLWNIFQQRQAEKRSKLETNHYELQKIRERVYYIASADPSGIYMFSDQQCEIYQGKLLPADLGGVSSKVTCHQFYQDLDPVITRFFSIKPRFYLWYCIRSGLLS
ncbi:hypothetical protein RMCBS344292_09729 [Rhizopus microsporus]|nr:hypothetical protein RMCBS344292_09729 [Rhizopus microsporus]